MTALSVSGAAQDHRGEPRSQMDGGHSRRGFYTCYADVPCKSNIAGPLDGSARSGCLNSAPVHLNLPTVGVAARTQKAQAIWGTKC
jgi:hypothetical protein